MLILNLIIVGVNNTHFNDLLMCILNQNEKPVKIGGEINISLQNLYQSLIL